MSNKVEEFHFKSLDLILLVWEGALEEYQEGLEGFFLVAKFEVSDGSKIRFWYDVWCGD
jgi:hypothetical protein